jgi:hypothetical protein
MRGNPGQPPPSRQAAPRRASRDAAARSRKTRPGLAQQRHPHADPPAHRPQAAPPRGVCRAPLGRWRPPTARSSTSGAENPTNCLTIGMTRAGSKLQRVARRRMAGRGTRSAGTRQTQFIVLICHHRERSSRWQHGTARPCPGIGALQRGCLASAFPDVHQLWTPRMTGGPPDPRRCCSSTLSLPVSSPRPLHYCPQARQTGACRMPPDQEQVSRTDLVLQRHGA